MIDLYILISLEAVPHCQMIWNDYLKYHVANVTYVCKSRKELELTGPSSVGPASSWSKRQVLGTMVKAERVSVSPVQSI